MEVGFEVVPPMEMGMPLVPKPAAFVRLAPAPARFATILKSSALLGLTVPAPVTVPSDGITRLILSRRVSSAAYLTSGLKFWIVVSLPVCLPGRAARADSFDPRLKLPRAAFVIFTQRVTPGL